MLSVFIFLAAPPLPEVVVIARDGDAISESFVESMVSEAPIDVHVLSRAEIASRVAAAGIVPTAIDDNDAKQRFKTDRDAAKATVDPQNARLLVERAIASAQSLSALQLEYRQVALRVAVEISAKLLFAIDPKSLALREVLAELVIRGSDASAAGFPASLQKRFADIASEMKRAQSGVIEINAQGEGEVSIDGAAFRALQPKQSFPVIAGPHEVFVRFRQGLGWTRRLMVQAGAVSTINCNAHLERVVAFSISGIRTTDALRADDAATLASLLRVQEVWTLEKSVSAARLTIAKDGAIANASIEDEHPAPVALRLAITQARGGRPGSLGIKLNEEGATVKVDGVVVGVSPIARYVSVAAGLHNVTAEKMGFLFTKRDALVDPGATSSVELLLLPSEEYKYAYVKRARTLRTVAWAGLGVGVAGLGAFAALFAVAEAQSRDYAAAVRTYNETEVPTQDERQGLIALGRSIAAMDVGAIVALSVGAAALTTGIVLFIVGDNPSRYDARVEVSLEPGSLNLQGAF